MSTPHPIALLAQQFPRLLRGQRPRTHSFLPIGWIQLATKLLAEIDRMFDEVEAAQFEILQIKQKLGSLRLYWRFGAPDGPCEAIAFRESSAMFERIEARVRTAELQSARTCERCGEEGASLRNSSGLVTLCESCWALAK